MGLMYIRSFCIIGYSVLIQKIVYQTNTGNKNNLSYHINFNLIGNSIYFEEIKLDSKKIG